VGFFKHPQQVWLRRVNFQIHLWSGIVLAVYAVIIGVTGSILVFGAELSGISKTEVAKPIADLSTVIDSLRTSYPHIHVVSVMAPTSAEPSFNAVLQSQKRFTVACDARTGQIIREVSRQPSRLDWVYDLHENLLARRTGRVVNGVCAASLLLLVLTGLVNWWPGVKNWRRALMVDFRRTWKRINFDLHRAAGFWALGFLAVWALTGIYFTWPAKVANFVDHLSPLVNSMPPAIVVGVNSDMAPVNFHELLTKAYAMDPGTNWKGIIFPSSRRSPFEMLMARAPGVGRDYEDTLYFNPYNGRYISTWQYGVNKSVGDWIIWLQIPLHFGTHWGLAVKCLWAGFGFTLPLLAVTGLLMYWNRVLSKKWRSLYSSQAAF